MTINVSKDVENAINAAVQSGQFASADEMIDTLVHEYQQRTQQAQPPAASHPATAPAHKPIWERILERSAAIPDEEWRKVPVDGAEQHDHYIYGTPKRPPRQ
jgi:Arc/MetJ-type ribon-helix-helix transcriptional regulator